MLDFHNHLMPGVDDGAQTLEQACAGITALAREGVATIITTPHLDGSCTRNRLLWESRMPELDAAWQELSRHAAQHHPDVTLLRGAEVMLDTPDPHVDDERVRLAGGAFMLVEFPFLSVPPRSAEAIADLRTRGCIPVIAHPERYSGFDTEYSLATQWRRRGGYLQVNGASLLGRYGQLARRFAFGLLERGLADYLCSDYHARGAVAVAAYTELLHELGGAEQVRLLTEANPVRILSDEAPLPVPPLRLKRSIWVRVGELFRAS